MSNLSEPPAPEEVTTSERLQLTLFVSGASPTSIRAVQRLRDLSDKNCPAGYDRVLAALGLSISTTEP